MNIFFWNLAKNELSSLVTTALKEYDIDIAFFCEYLKTDFNKIITNLENTYEWIDGFGACNKVTCLIRKPNKITFLQEQSRFTIYNVAFADETTDTEKEYIIACVHLPDMRNSPKPYVRMNVMKELTENIKVIEKNDYKRKTIVLGDFNAEPYSDEMLLRAGMNTVLFKKEMDPETVKIGNANYRRFYNPILNCISEDKEQYGSFRFGNDPGPIWHCLDQLLMRKSAMPDFYQFKYIKKIGNITLIKRKNPDKTYSDHLPFIATFKI